MNPIQKSLIDNWSLEQAGILLDSNSDTFSLDQSEFISSLGGLSNYINAILLYDQTNFLANGFEQDWRRFGWFQRKTEFLILPISVEELNIDWYHHTSYSDQGIKNYLVSAEKFKTDLFVSPQRAEIIKHEIPKINNDLAKIFGKVDNAIGREANDSWSDKIKIGIERNFSFPSLTQYVLSQATNQNDLLQVITQIKQDGKVKVVRDKIDEISTSTLEFSKFQKEVESLIKLSFGGKKDNDDAISLELSVLFLSASKSIDMDFFRRKRYLLFLKDLIACRTEANNLHNNIHRIFQRKLQ